MTIADIVFLSGKVAAVDRSFSFHEAVALKNGLILDVGTDEGIRSYIGSGTRVIDLKGRLLLPAAYDSHMHGTSFAMNNRCLNCGAPLVTNLEQLQAALAEESSGLLPGQWIRGANYNSNMYKVGPTRWDLDAFTGDHPAILMDVTGHGALANSKALEISGLDRNTPDPDGGYLGRDENGELTGVLTEASAIQLVFSHAPQWTDEELCQGILRVQELLNREGYAGYTESTVGPANDQREYGAAGRRVIELYKRLYRDGKLTTRVSLGYYTGDCGVQTAEAMERDLSDMPSMEGVDPRWLKMDMAKIFCDGVPLLHSAWLLEDYADRPGFHGRSCLCGEDAGEEEQVRELRKMIEIAHMHGMQAGVHAIGDRAVEEAIEAIVAAKQAHPETEVRHYVIHGEYHGRERHAQRAAEFGIPYSVQPEVGGFVYETAGAQVGDRGERCCDLKTPLEAGVVLCGGSDAIAGDFENWRMAAQIAVTRKSIFSGKVCAPDLRVSIEDVVRMFTINAAYQEGAEKWRGSIEPGKAADLQVLERDIFNESPDTIGSIGVVMTVVDGRIVYDNGTL